MWKWREEDEKRLEKKRIEIEKSLWWSSTLLPPGHNIFVSTDWTWQGGGSSSSSSSAMPDTPSQNKQTKVQKY